LLTTNSFLAGFGGVGWAPRVTLFLTDDFVAAESLRPWRDGYEAAWHAVRERALPVAAVSQTILDRVEPTGPAIVVPNGIEPSEWERPRPAPAWLGALPRPHLIYIGGLDDRVDVEQLRATAAAVPGCTIVLVGTVFDSHHVAQLERVPGVVIRPPVGRSELAALVGAADACLIPHRRTALTQAMSPIKVFEYLAAGRPVAAVDLPPLRGLGGRVILAPEPADFGEAVRGALALPALPEHERLAFIEDNAWSRRHDQLVALAVDGYS
jgi:glycosyltransferase involved in cell wall biosynthesis